MVHAERSQPPGTWICCVPCYWLRRSEAVHKALLTFAMLLVTSLLVTSPVLFLITTLPEGDQPRDCAPLDDACIREQNGLEDLCTTEACNEASRKMLASMNRNVDPCTDFYRFACGGYSDHEFLLSSSSFTILQKQVDRKIQKLLANETGKMVGVFHKLGLFYSSCTEHKNKDVNFTQMYAILEEFGGYIPPRNSAPSDITPLVANLLKVNGAPLFDFYLDVDLYNHSRMSIFLDLPSKHLANTFPSQKQDTNGEIRCQMIEQILQNFLPQNMGKRERSYETYLLMQFCLALSKIYPRQKDLYDWVDVDQRVYVPYNLTYLQDSFSYIRWKTLLNFTLAETDINNKYNHGTMTDDQRIYVYITAPRYFRSLGKLLNQFSKRIIYNSLLFLYAVDTLYDIVNVTTNDHWNNSCNKLTKVLFPETVGAVYVQQYKVRYLEILAGQVNHLFERIKETLAERILIKSWLDDHTRAQVLLKLAHLRGKFSVWSGFFNKTLLQKEAAKIIVEPDNFIKNVMRRFRQIRRPMDQVLRSNFKERWRSPYAVNAYYESSTNSIVPPKMFYGLAQRYSIPLALSLSKFQQQSGLKLIVIPLAMMTAVSWSWEGGPAYSAHATLGSVIAHEILHAFDLHRRRYNSDPIVNVNNWLRITPKSWNQLEARIECIAKLYARRFWRKIQYYGDEVDVQFDWNVTKNENVADIGAIQISYQTWHTLTNGRDRTLPLLEALRPSQMFFISAAQTYCTNTSTDSYLISSEHNYHIPSPERVNVVMMNSLSFAEAFRCSTSTRMNPPNKCSTW